MGCELYSKGLGCGDVGLVCGGGGGELRVCGTETGVRCDAPSPIKCDMYYILSVLFTVLL